MRSHIQTLRFAPEELMEIQQFLEMNPGFASLSALGRVAVMDFIRHKTEMAIVPTQPSQSPSRPSFLWDYDLTREQVLEILRHRPMQEKKWLIAKILEHAKLDEVFHYLKLKDIADALPHVQLKPATKAHWQKAVRAWTKNTKT